MRGATHWAEHDRRTSDLARELADSQLSDRNEDARKRVMRNVADRIKLRFTSSSDEGEPTSEQLSV